MPSVNAIARTLWASNFAVRQLGTVDDVAAYGMIGLLDAARRFDRRRKIKLATYAASRIRGAIFDAVRQTAEMIRTPRLAIQRGEPSLGVGSLEQLHAWFENDSGRFSGWLPATETPARDDAPLAIERFLKGLRRKERSIVRLYFGIGLSERLSMKEVGALWGLSESRVSQIVTDILRRGAERVELRDVTR